MSVIIHPYGMLKDYIGGATEISTEAGRSVRESVAACGIPPEVVALITVNDQQQDKDFILQEGDVVKLLAVIGGG